MKDELNAYGRTIGEEIETKYIRSDELEIIKSSKLYEYVEDIYDKPTSSKFLKLTAYMALNILKGICSIVLPMAAIAFLVFLCSKMGAYSLGRVIKCEYSKYRYSIFFIEYYRLFNVYSIRLL